jgi:hypothetical protein
MDRDNQGLLVAIGICVVLVGIAIAYIGLSGLLSEQPGQSVPNGSVPTASPVPSETVSLTPLQTVSGGGSTPAPPKTFSLAISPQSATARSGEAIRYTLTITPDNGFSEPVRLTITATALNGIFRDSRDLGTATPPYPPIYYDIVAPELPPLISEATVDATVTASGGGVERTKTATLIVRR